MEALTELLASGKLGPQDYRTTMAGLEEVRFSPEGFGMAMDGEIAFGFSTFNGLREQGLTFGRVRGDMRFPLLGILLKLPPVQERERRLYFNFPLENRSEFQGVLLVSQVERTGGFGQDREELEKSLLADILVPNDYRARISYRNLVSCLEALVPSYLPAVPRDFMAPDGQFRYRLQGRDMVLETGSPLRNTWTTQTARGATPPTAPRATPGNPTGHNASRQDRQTHLNPPPGVRTEGVEAGLDARKACVLRSGA